MAETAENLAEQYKLDRGCVDEFALRSQQLSKAAWEEGVFKDEVVAVPIPESEDRQDGGVRDRRAHAARYDRRKARRAQAGVPKGGVVTAGNASGIGDGAGAMVIASEKFARDRGSQAAGAARVVGSCRRRSVGDGNRPGAGVQNGARKSRAVDGRHGSHRSQRGVCRPNLRRRARAVSSRASD